MVKRIGLSALILFGLVAPILAAPIKFARAPHIAKGKIVSAYHGDILIAGEDGSHPRRQTARVATDSTPRFSPDGTWIAFTSDRMGNNDVYVVPVEGGEPRQLTFMTADDTVLSRT